MTGTIPLGELVTIRGGGTPSRSVPAYWNGEIRWATVKDFKSTELAETKESITLEGINNSATNVIPAGSVIVPTRMAVGKAAINTVDIAINQDLKALLPNCQVNSRFLLHFMLAQGKYLESQAQGATVKGIKLDLLRALPFPKTSPVEQRQIATILDKADAIRRKREQALTLADDFLRSAFHEMFGDPTTNALDLPTTSVEAICDLITDCLHTTPNHFDEPNEYPSIRSSELQGGYIDLSSAKYVSEAEYKVRIQRYRPVAGDTIYCREGARFGNCGIIPEGMTPCLGQRTMLLRANLKVATPEYLWAVLCSKSIFEQAGNVVGGAASPHVNIKDIRKFKCLRPPLELQRQFSLMCQRVFAQRCRHFRQGEDAETLFSSLSQRAFRGEL